MEEKISVADDIHQHSEHSCSGLITQTSYFWSSKRIPEDLLMDLTTTEKHIAKNFEPHSADTVLGTPIG